jgi:hypothetical protein
MSTVLPAAAPRPKAPVGFVVALVLFGLAAAAVNAVYAFGMLFATDSCGTDAGTAALCNTAVWLLLVLLPWGGLLGALLTGGLGGAAARRRGRSPWLALLPCVGVYLLSLAVVYLTVFA